MTAAIEKIINKLIEHNLSFHHFTDSKNIAVQASLKHGLALQYRRLHCPHTVGKQNK